jgi:hypothetical protein
VIQAERCLAGKLLLERHSAHGCSEIGVKWYLSARGILRRMLSLSKRKVYSAKEAETRIAFGTVIVDALESLAFHLKSLLACMKT